MKLKNKNKKYYFKDLKLYQFLYLLFFRIKSFLIKNYNKPLLAGVKITNNCNLKCIHCPFWRNNNKKSISWTKITKVLKTLYNNGVRIVIFEGGEPLLWKDEKENKNINDILNYSKKYFFITAITTNGTINFSDITSDIIFVSIDGLKNTHNKIRGNTFDLIIKNIENANKFKKIIANITINKINYDEIIELIKFLQNKVYGVTIQFFYPYENIEDFSLSTKQKEKIINELINLKNQEYNILDSKSALKSMIYNKWNCKDYLVANVEPDGKINYGCYLKNRTKNISCKDCGFLAHCEISLAFNLNIAAIINAKKIFW